LISQFFDSSRQSIENDEDLITRIAWLYYQEKKTQQDIGTQLNLSRPKVQRLLERARDLEIVRFQIKNPYFNLLSIEQQLNKRMGLFDSVVVPTITSEQDMLRRSFARACSEYIERILRRDAEISLGFGWGNTTSFLADYFDPLTVNAKTSVVSLIGNLMVSVAMNPYISAERIARKLNAPFYNIWAPAIAQSKERAEIFMSEPWIDEALQRAGNCDIAIISIGEVSESASLFEMGFLTAEDLARLQKKGAVGDILSRFIDDRGNVIDDEIHDRVIGISLDVLRRAETLVIGVSGGASKFDAVRAAIAGGFVDVLITDETIATELCKTI
jgi:DNA-binding transcriptional regulator LsrR (DeoR family)